MVSFIKATKSQSRLRMTIDGPSGSGKTFTSLTFAMALANGGKIAVIDTERGSASKYADRFAFDVLELDTYSPQNYISGIVAAQEAGYTVLVIDSLSHAWEGKGGVLEMHEDATARDRARNSYTAWRDVTPKHRALVDAMLQSPCHIIATMRSKTEYALVENDKGRLMPQKMGLAPIQRKGMEYEFDIVADMDIDHKMVISKTRCFEVDGDVIKKPDAKWFATVAAWLTDGAPRPEEPEEGDDDGLITDPEPTKATIGGRPYTPEALQTRLTAAIETFNGEGYGIRRPTEKQLGRLRWGIGQAIGATTDNGMDQERHLLLEFLTGNPSSKDLTLSQWKAIWKWLGIEEHEGDWSINFEDSPKEAKAVVKLAMEEAGQEVLL